MTLNEILTQVAEGKLSALDAEALIRRNPPRRPRSLFTRVVGGLMFVVVGLGCAIAGTAVGLKSSRFLAAADEAEGTVVKVFVETGPGHRAYSVAAVRFEVNGKPFGARCRHAGLPPWYEIGQKVTVYFPPAHPDKARVYSFAEFWFAPVVFGCGSAMFILLGIAVALRPAPPLPAAPIAKPSVQ